MRYCEAFFHLLTSSLYLLCSHKSVQGDITFSVSGLVLHPSSYVPLGSRHHTPLCHAATCLYFSDVAIETCESLAPKFQNSLLHGTRWLNFYRFVCFRSVGAQFRCTYDSKLHSGLVQLWENFLKTSDAVHPKKRWIQRFSDFSDTTFFLLYQEKMESLRDKHCLKLYRYKCKASRSLRDIVTVLRICVFVFAETIRGAP